MRHAHKLAGTQQSSRELLLGLGTLQTRSGSWGLLDPLEHGDEQLGRILIEAEYDLFSLEVAIHFGGQ